MHGRRRRRLLHRARALRHHSLAVLREFRGPIVGFLTVTLVGGFLYGELHTLARGTRIPLIDRPYVILQLMLLEAPETVPAEWYLVAFWYGLPLVFVLLVGLGAADFVDLFLNRSDDRDAWSEALAMTYRDHVIVLGAGHIGLRVVRDLVDMGIETVVVDAGPGEDALEALERLDVPVVKGDGRRIATLEKARYTEAEAFVACTSNDQVNLEAVMKVRDANPAARIVVRMWDPSSARQIERFMDAQAVLSASALAAPAFAGAAVGIEITQTLKIAGVEYSTIRLAVAPGSFLGGRAVAALEGDEEIEVVLHCRGDRVEPDPGPDVEVREGDDLVIFGRHQRILEIVARNRGGRPGRG